MLLWLALIAAPIDVPFEVEAERLEMTASPRVYVAEGAARFSSRDRVLYANTLRFDEVSGVVVATGDVVVIEGTRVVRCERVTLKVPELTGGLSGGRLLFKKGISAAALQAMGREAGDAAANELLVEVDRAERLDRTHFRVEGAEFTPCDCGEGSRPSWAISASEATLDVERGAWLFWPVFRILDVPVFALPVAYLPLGSRRSGVLMPDLVVSGAVGFRAALPLYLAVDRTWDATFTPAYLTSRGPAPELEFRWTPSRRSRGSMTATFLVDDLGVAPRSGDTRNPHLRWYLLGAHETVLGSHRLAAQVQLARDPNFLAEFAESYLDRASELSVSSLVHTFSRPEFRVSSGVSIRQDRRQNSYLQGQSLARIDLFGRSGEGAGYRFLDFRFDSSMAPLFSGASGPYARVTLRGSVHGVSGDGDRTFGRVDVRPEISAPMDLGGVMLEPRVTGRLTGWAGEEVSGRAAVIFDTALRLPLYRQFSGGWTHRIDPALRYLVVPRIWGERMPMVDDEIDRLGPVQQVTAELSTKLLRDGREQIWLRGLVGADLGVAGGPERRPPLLSVDGGIDWLWAQGFRLRLSGLGVVDLDSGLLGELRGSASAWIDAYSFGATFMSLADALPERSLVAPEELVPSATVDRSGYLPLPRYRADRAEGRTGIVPFSAYRGLSVFARAAPLSMLDLAVFMTLDLSATAGEVDRDGRPVSRSAFLSVGGEIGFTSTCDCWGLRVRVAHARDRSFPDIRVMLDLARLGSIQN